MNMRNFALATTALVGSLVAAGAAMAQSTGTEAVEQVVVTASTLKNQNGAIVSQTITIDVAGNAGRVESTRREPRDRSQLKGWLDRPGDCREE